MVGRDWQNTTVSSDGTHHLLNDLPLYEPRFLNMLPYHAPGLAPVRDLTGAYHIDVAGKAIYAQRFLQTFGYYHGLAAVEQTTGWFHIDTHGKPIYSSIYAWCGNFQQRVCTVKDKLTGRYYHIDKQGQRLYAEDYRYAGDYREGAAVVTTEAGLQTHIADNGSCIHSGYFISLSVFHKNIACAKDDSGWFHIDRAGTAMYAARYKAIEPYYNNIALVEDFDGSLLTIDLAGRTTQVVRAACRDLLHEASADLVSFWKTQTIYAAVQLKVFDCLPNTVMAIANNIDLELSICQRFMYALQELELVILKENDSWHLTAKGALFHPTSASTMAAAALIWGGSHYNAWQNLTSVLQNSTTGNPRYFEELARSACSLQTYHAALSGYATHDYKKVLEVVDWSCHATVIDAGGGTGTLLHMLLNHYSHLTGYLLEMPAVIDLISPEQRLSNGNYCATDLMANWQCQADAILLARVLHDWPDDQALMLLKRAKDSLSDAGKIYLLDMILPIQGSKGRLLDMNMLVMTNGRERTLSDWQGLANAADLKIKRTVGLTPVVSLIELMSD